MTEDDRKRCKTVCDNEGKGSETFYDFKRVQYDYTDKNIIHMGKDGEKAGLAKIPPEKSFKDYKGKAGKDKDKGGKAKGKGHDGGKNHHQVPFDGYCSWRGSYGHKRADCKKKTV